MADRKPMVKTIPATQARNQFGEVLKRVYRDGEQLIIEKDGLPVAAILSYLDYERYRGSAALSKFAELSKMVSREIQARDWTEEQVMESLEEAKQEVFEEHYGKALRTSRRKKVTSRG
jgi:prevent-host-death family protein